MATVSSHGGRCCGIRHIYGLSDFRGLITSEQLKNLVKQFNGKCRTRGRLMEIVATDAQLRDPQLLEALKENKFKLVQRFINANSGNYCNVFHFHPRPQPLDDLPFDWSNT